jgi:hypothetical protein
MPDDTQGPTIFEPDDEHRTLARNLGVDLDRELEAFRAFNRNREVRNPARAFTGWLRRAHANPQTNVVVGRPATPAIKPGDPIGEYATAHPEEFGILLAYLKGHKWWNDIPEGVQQAEIRQAIRDRETIFAHLNYAPKAAS